MPANIKLSTLSVKPIRLPTGRLNTQIDYRDGVAPGGGTLPAGSIIFEDNFDSQPDWTADEIILAPNVFDPTAVPPGWYYGNSRPLWSPAKTGELDKHPVSEILAVNSGKAKGKTGKSFVKWRESSTNGQYNSDGILLKYFPEGHDEIYVEFEIMLSELIFDLATGGTAGATKVFRCYYYDETTGEPTNYFSSNTPFHVWDLALDDQSAFGCRNFQNFRARGAALIKDSIQAELGRAMNGGDVSLGYAAASMTGRAVGGGDPELTDRLNGGIIGASPVLARQIFGAEDEWVKVAFYYKMNSAPGVEDGLFMQWIDDKRVVLVTKAAWVGADASMVKWNMIGIGGNSKVDRYSEAVQYEDWFSIDNIAVYNGIPPNRGLV